VATHRPAARSTPERDAAALRATGALPGPEASRHLSDGRGANFAAVTIALLVVTAVAVAACALLVRDRSQLQGSRAEIRRERDELATRLTRTEAALATHASDLQALTEARDVVVADWAATTSEHRRLTAQLDEERRARAGAEASADHLRAQLEQAGARPPDEAGGRDGGDADGRWMLLLAHIARRWAAVVGAPPDAREVALGAVSDQFAEGLSREVERVREEVGVSVELAAADPVEPADPVTSLLAAIDVLGVLAAGSERVIVDTRDQVELRGEGWTGPDDELVAARARSTAAGVAVGEVEISEGTARLVVALGDPDQGPVPTH
jgi:hypothetical protein